MSKLRQRIIRMSIAGLIVFALVVGWGFLFSWRRLPYYEIQPVGELPVPVMTGEEYADVIATHPRPYIVHVKTEGGAVLVFGADHTKDPDAPQIAEIRRHWAEFEPTVALCESRLGILFPGLMDPVEVFGEPGAVHRLARRAGIPTYTWEPTPGTFMAHLLDQPFTKEQLALRLKFNAYFSNRRFGRPADPEAFVADAIGDGSRSPGLEGVLSTPEELDRAWAKHFPDGPDWREVSDEYGLPGFLAEIDTNTPRDAHFVRVIADLAGKGERVFAVAGVSHAVKIEAAVKGLLQNGYREN